MIGSLVRLKPDYWKIKRSLFLNSLRRIQLMAESFEDLTGKKFLKLGYEEFLDLADSQIEFSGVDPKSIKNWYKILHSLFLWFDDSIDEPNVPYFSMKITFSEFYDGGPDCFHGFSRPFGSYLINEYWLVNDYHRIYGFRPDPKIVKNDPLSRPNLVTDFVEADQFRMLPEIPDPELEQISYDNFTLSDYSEITSKGMISLLISNLDLGPFHNWCRDKNQKIYFPVELFEVVSEG